MSAAVITALLIAAVLFAPSPAAAHSFVDGDPHQHYAVELSRSMITEGDTANTVDVTVRYTASCLLHANINEPHRHANAYIDISINTVAGVSLSTHRRASFQSDIGSSNASMGRSRGTDTPIRITLTDDAVRNGHRDVTVSGSAFYRPGNQNYFYNNFDLAPIIQSATLTITDNDTPAIVVSESALAVV